MGEMHQVAGHAILGRVGSSSANLTQIVANTDNTILGRTTGNLEFGKVTNAQLNGGITKDKISSVNASAVDGELAAGNFGADTIALGTKTTGNYVADVDAGNSGITIGGTAGEGTTFTVNHANTSDEPSMNNSDGFVVQDVTLDGYGHVTNLGNTNLDSRYYTETEINNQFGGGSTTGERYVFGLSTSSSRNGNTGRTIFVAKHKEHLDGYTLHAF